MSVYFVPEEFKCECNRCGLGFESMDQEFFQKLSRARLIAKIPFKINSSIRCKIHNRGQGGSETSSHLIGRAVDIAAANGRGRYLIVRALMDAGFNRLGIGKNFIHVDDDPAKPRDVMWVY